MSGNKINIKQIRLLAGRYAAGELQDCIRQAIDTGSNTCLVIADQAEGVSLLSMAGFVRARMEQDDVSISRALRILGRRMRSLSAEP